MGAGSLSLTLHLRVHSTTPRALEVITTGLSHWELDLMRERPHPLVLGTNLPSPAPFAHPLRGLIKPIDPQQHCSHLRTDRTNQQRSRARRVWGRPRRRTSSRGPCSPRRRSSVRVYQC